MFKITNELLLFLGVLIFLFVAVGYLASCMGGRRSFAEAEDEIMENTPAPEDDDDDEEDDDDDDEDDDDDDDEDDDEDDM